MRQKFLILPVFISFFLFFSSYFYTKSANFYKPVDGWVYYSYLFDVILSMMVVYVFFSFKKNARNKISSSLSIEFKAFINKNWRILFIISFICFVEVALRAKYIISGATREYLVSELGRSRFMMIAPQFFNILLPISFVFNYEKKIKVLCVFGFIFSSIYLLERTNLLIASYVYLMLVCIRGVNVRNVFKLCLIAIVIGIIGSIMTYLQGRGDNIISAFFLAFDSLFKYRAFSFYLSEIVINKLNFDMEKILFPFFGFLSERFLSFFSILQNPISVPGSTFISEFHRLGKDNNLVANVVYPYWSWFYGIYGFLGIIIKPFYMLFVTIVIYKLRYYGLLIYWLVITLFMQYTIHPFLNNDAIYSFIGVIFVDVCFKFWERRNKF